MKAIQSLLLASILTGAFATQAFAQARAFTVRNDGGSRVQFVSDAPLETITGVTSGLSGEVTFDPAHVTATRGRVAATVATIRTGVDLRDEHLRSNTWLDAARFPNATFEIVSIEGAAALRPNEVATLQVHGRFSIHGVTHDVTTTARVRFLPLTAEMSSAPGITGDVLRIQASFTVRLTDYNVSVPLPVRLKVSDEIQVNVDLRAIAAPAAAH